MWLDIAEISLFQAFSSDKDEIFYLSETTDRWQKINSHITRVEI